MRYTEMLALAMGNVAAAQFTTTRFANTTTMATGTGTETGIDTTTATIGTETTGTMTGSETSTSTAAPGAGNPDGFNFLGCFSSEAGFPSFSQAYSSEENDSEMCAEACLGSNFFGLYDNACYCGSELDLEVSPSVGTEQCDISCPGNEDESCGGLAGGALMRRQVEINVLLSIYVAIGISPDGETETVSITDFVTETLPAVTTTATVTFTEDGTTATATVTRVIAAVPTDVIIICYGNYCAPQVHCPTCSKWQIVCEDGYCSPRECHDDSWDKLLICNSGNCHYASYKEEECNQRIVCYGSHCERDQHYTPDYARKYVCDVEQERYYFEECKDDCYTYNTCSKGECEVVPPPAKEPVHPPKTITPGKPPVVVVPEEPSKPGKPVHPETPSKPGKPTEPETPSKPGYPEHPGKPSEPEHPGKPSQPETPSKPGYPEHPQQPGKPSEPETPGKPAEPETPGKPAEPETPGKPAEPETPGKPAEPEHPETGESEKPEEPPVVTAGSAKNTFAGVAAAVAAFAFFL